MDEIDDLLTPVPIPQADPDARSALWGRLAAVQRRRRLSRYARWTALVAVCFVAGAASHWWWQRPAAERPGLAAVKPVDPPAAPAPAPAPRDAEADPYRDDPPQVIERWAMVAVGRRRVELYRRAGDLYYERLGDHAAAIRCYRKALDGGTDADLAVHADNDNWLLMSLKVARLKEKRHAEN